LRNALSILLVLISFGLLLPGVLRPMLSVEADFEVLGLKTTLFKYSRSVVETVDHLWKNNNRFVASLIAIFSIMVPVVKGLLLIMIVISSDPVKRYRIYTFIGSVSKWSMSDVFAMGVFVCFLAANSNVHLKAQLEPGFFFFVFYCLVSLASLQVLYIEDPHDGVVVYSPVHTEDDEGRARYYDHADDDVGSTSSANGATPIGRVGLEHEESDEETGLYKH